MSLSFPALPHRLFAILKIRPSETSLVALVTGLMFCAMAGGAIGSPGIEALFFSRFGVQFLPHMYLALGLVIVATSLAITALLGRVLRERLYVVLPLGMAAVLLGARLLVAFDFNWFYPPLWLGMNVFWSLLNLFTWGLAGAVCDTRQAKRLFPLFGAGGILGLAAGGLLTGPLVAWLGAENLLLAWAAALVLAFFLARSTIRSHGPVARRSRRQPTQLLAGVIQGYHLASRSPLLRWMALAAALFAILYYSVVYPFSRAVAAEFASEDALAAFLGVFQGLSMAAALLASLFLANRLYARYGFMATILVYSLLYFLGFAALAVSAVFPLLVVFRFSQLLWSEGVTEGANQAMYNLVPPDQREQTRAFVRGVVNPAGVTLVGGILLFSERYLPPTSIYLVGLVAAALAAYFVWRARAAYGQALVEALRAGHPQIFYAEEEPFGGFKHDAGAMAAVVQGLSSPEVAARRVSAEIFANLAAPAAVSAVLSALEDEDPDVRAALLRSLARSGAVSALPQIFAALQDPHSQVRLAAILALRTLAPQPGELRPPASKEELLRPPAPHKGVLSPPAPRKGVLRALAVRTPELLARLQPLLLDPDPAVRSQAAASLLSAGPHPQAEQALRELAARAETHDRVTALQALDTWGSQSAYDIAAQSLHDPHPAIRAAAAPILARLDPHQCLSSLVNLLGDEDPSVRRSAAHALGELGPPALQPVLAALADPALESGALLALERLPVQPFKQTLFVYARRQLGKALDYHHLRLATTALPRPTEALRLLADALRDRSLHHGANVLKTVALFGNAAAITLALENLDHADPGQRANALETLESLGDRQLVGPLLVLWEPGGAKEPAPDGWLVRLLQSEHPWLRACAALAVKDSDDPQAWAELTRLEHSDPDELVRATARRVLSGDRDMKTLPTLSLMERILFLRRVPLFAGLPPADLKQIAAITGEHLFPSGQAIASQGELGEEMYIIVSGEVKVITRTRDGAEVEIVRRGPGEFVGEMAIINRSPRMASLTAVGDVRALCIEQADFEEILRQRPETSLAVMRVLCQRLMEPYSDQE